jgi:hypothetical protein
MREGNHLEDPGVDVKIILKWIFRRWDVGHALDRSGSGCGEVTGNVNAKIKFGFQVNAGNFLTS